MKDGHGYCLNLPLFILASKGDSSGCKKHSSHIEVSAHMICDLSKHIPDGFKDSITTFKLHLINQIKHVVLVRIK